MHRQALLLAFCLPLFSQAQYDCRSLKSSPPQGTSCSIDNRAKSDSFDLQHFDIRLDLSAIEQGGYQAECRIHFQALRPNLRLLNLDILKLQVDSIAYFRAGLRQKSPRWQSSDSLLRLRWPEALRQSDEQELRIYYRGNSQVDASGWGGFHAEKGYYYNLGIGFAANPHNYGRSWFPCFDNFVEKSTYQLQVRSRLPLLPLLSGAEIERQRLAGDTVLSSARLDLPIPSYLVSFALADYQFLRDSLMAARGPIPILLAAKAADTTALKASFSQLKPSFHALEKYFGPYPWPRIGYAMTTVGAMEHATSIHFPIRLVDGTKKGEDIMVHELAHHWFGNLITCESADDMWINEGMAEFCSHLYEEAVYGKARYQHTVRENAFRVLEEAARRDKGHRPLYAPPHEYVYGFHVYQKGAMVGHNMRYTLGDSLFFGLWQQLLDSLAYQNINTAQLRDYFQQKSGLSAVEDFWQQWIYSPGYPQVRVAQWHYDSLEARGALVLEQALYAAAKPFEQLKVPLRFIAADGREYERDFWLSGYESQHPIDSLPFVPRHIIAGYSPQVLLASVWDSLSTTGASAQKGPFSGLSLRREGPPQPGRWLLMKHYAGAERQPDNPLPFSLLSSRYYSAYALRGKARQPLSLGIDFALRPKSENAVQADQLLLVFRRQGEQQWRPYPFQRKQIESEQDGQGQLIADSLRSGDYALAYSTEPLLLWPEEPQHEALKLSAQGAEGYIGLALQGRRQLAVYIANEAGSRIYEHQAYQGSGQHRHRISTSDWPAGYYRLQVNDQRFHLIKR